ncbi:hypothetical protein IGI04_042637 [Brassica rapa subsp. trilocularis]|uniref:Uncharacterized protein n=1 Tax=Brassica rapa subsp. trilocularis TaxID=1813537 RepID=A0ABQ7KIZ9_BRACM|nr:hypothetical protein IGI04_042637 [Brassica rapa subsp. trilocularis]
MRGVSGILDRDALAFPAVPACQGALELVVVKEKPELEDEYGDQTTRPPDQKDVKLRVHGLMLMTRTWIGSSWREAFNCKLNKVEKSSALEATCSEESSKMLLRHEEGLQSFVFHPGETREVMIYLMARSGTLELNYQGSVILQSLDLRTNPFKGGGDGVILIRIGINGLKPMYGSAVPLIMVQFNGQYHTLIGMIYEVLDREKRRTVGTALKQLEQRGFNQLSLTGAMETIHLVQICMENKENMSGSFWIRLYLDLGEIRLFRLGSLIWCAISRSEALEYQEGDPVSVEQKKNIFIASHSSKEKTISITFHPPTPPSSDPGRDSHSRATPRGIRASWCSPGMAVSPWIT